MRKPVKLALIALGAVVGLVVIAAAIVAATFDPDAYKPLLVERVRQDTQRTLAIPGHIELTFFPKLGVRLGSVSLSAHGSAEPFASARSARVSLAVLPLLRKQVVVDRVKVDGLRLHLVRFADGSTSIDDLVATPAKKDAGADARASGQAVQFDIAGLSVTDASISVDDRQAGRRVELTKAGIETGRIAPGTPGDVRFEGHATSDHPELDADIDLKGNLLLDPAQRRYAFRDLVAELKGRAVSLQDLKARLAGSADIALEPLALKLGDIAFTAQGRSGTDALDARIDVPRLDVGEKDITAQKIDAKVSLKQGPRTVRAQLAVPSFAGSAQAFKVPAIGGEFGIDDGALQAKATLTGTLDGDWGRQVFSSPQWTLAFDGKRGDTAIKGTLATAFSADLKAQVVALTRIAADLALPNPKGGSMALKAGGGVTAMLAKHTLQAGLNGRLDQSEFSAKLGLRSYTPAAWTFDVTIDQIDLDRYRAAPAPGKPGAAPAAAEAPIDASPLRTLDATGSLRVGSLRVANISTRNLRVDVRAARGKVELNPLAADLYQGSVAGSLALEASTPPRLALKQKFTGISIGPLLKDAVGRQMLDGRGNVVLDVTSQGATVAAIEKALAGSARIELRDGAVHGVNVAQAIRSAKALFGGASSGPQSGTGSQAESTDFTELSASFAIARGVAHNEDLQAKTPLLRVAGRGDVDLGESRLDYLVKATIVDTLKGQGSADLQALRGVTVPVRLKGPFASIGYSVDVADLAKDVATKKVEDALKAKAQEQLGSKLKGLFGR